MGSNDVRYSRPTHKRRDVLKKNNLKVNKKIDTNSMGSRLNQTVKGCASKIKVVRGDGYVRF